MAGLDQRIAAVYGVTIDTRPLVPAPSARPGAQILAAEQVALALGEARPRRQRTPEPTWDAIPSPALPPGFDRDRTLAALLAWARAGGVDFDAIEIVVAPDGNRGVRARRAIGEDEPIVAVPRALVILDEDVARTPIGAAVTEVGDEIRSGHTMTSAWLARERLDPTSRWKPYLDALPPVLPDVPWFRGGAELDLLAGTAARAAAADAHASVSEDHAVVARRPVLAGLALADFAWARAILGSRAFKVSIEGRDLRALVPVADLFDHGPESDATWGFDEARDAFVITSLRPIEAGEEIRFSYGPYGNARYLVGYGFAVPDNDHDDALIRFAATREPRTDLAGHLLWDLPLGGDAPLELGTRYDGVARRAMSVARLRASTPRELVAAADRGRFHKRELRWLGSRIEQAALLALAAAARAGAKAIGPEPVLPADASSWARTCAVVRAGERAVLDRLVAFTEAIAPHVAAPSAYAWRAAAEALGEDATGVDRLVREYLLATAGELPK